MKILPTIMLCFILWNANSQINNDYLKIDEKAPQITGIDQFDNIIDSKEILKENKILLVFYRGNWCPYCKKHLLELQENLEKLESKGIRVLVVTPEKSNKIEETTKNFQSTFSILHDVDNKIMNDYKVAFEVNEQNVLNYLNFTQKKIEEYNEINNNILPVPATYLIDKNALISYVHYNPDYKKRASFDEIMKLLD